MLVWPIRRILRCHRRSAPASGAASPESEIVLYIAVAAAVPSMDLRNVRRFIAASNGLIGNVVVKVLLS
jgi:hypothetical protein